MAYEIEEAKRLVIEGGYRLVEAGLIARTWGNISARISDTQFVITPSGRAYDDLTPEDIVVVNIADCSYEGGVKPSSERGVHAAGYLHRPDVNYIIHTHQAAATAVGTLGETVESEGLKIPCGKYAISSTKALAKKMSDAIAKNLDADVFFMRYHGLLVLGNSMDDCFDKALKTEDICEKMLLEKCPEKITNSPEVALSEKLVKKIGKAGVILSDLPSTRIISAKGKTIRPMIDDLAQIGGVNIPCVASVADTDAIAKCLRKRGAVLISGVGAICAADSLDDAQAMAQVLEKNCLAQRFCEANGRKHHLGYFDAMSQRNVYVKKYSKLK